MGADVGLGGDVTTFFGRSGHQIRPGVAIGQRSLGAGGRLAPCGLVFLRGQGM